MELAAAILIQERLNPVATSPGAQALLRSEDWQRLASAVQSNLARKSSPHFLPVRKGNGEACWLVWLTPMLDTATGTNGNHLLLVFDPERSPGCMVSMLQATYSLTGAETRLVEQLLQGRSPAEAARELEVTIHTVRTYLKRLYQKLGVKSQAMLVWKLLQTASLPYHSDS